jgi:hypothetical protein
LPDHGFGSLVPGPRGRSEHSWSCGSRKANRGFWSAALKWEAKGHATFHLNVILKLTALSPLKKVGHVSNAPVFADD